MRSAIALTVCASSRLRNFNCRWPRSLALPATSLGFTAVVSAAATLEMMACTPKVAASPALATVLRNRARLIGSWRNEEGDSSAGGIATPGSGPSGVRPWEEAMAPPLLRGHEVLVPARPPGAWAAALPAVAALGTG